MSRVQLPTRHLGLAGLPTLRNVVQGSAGHLDKCRRRHGGLSQWELDPIDGTSAASPFMGGLVADADSGCGRVGVFTPLLYSLYAQGSMALPSPTSRAEATTSPDQTVALSRPLRVTTQRRASAAPSRPVSLARPSLSCQFGLCRLERHGKRAGTRTRQIHFGSVPATVTAATAISATVIVPAGTGTVTVSATGITGDASRTALFTYGSPPPPPVEPPPVIQPSSASHGYWLVGSDGGIFTFGSAQFYGSTGSLRLQRPVVGIVPTSDRNGYWLDASDGGVFGSAIRASTDRCPASDCIPPGRVNRIRSMHPLSGWCLPPTAVATSWWRQMAGSSPSAMHGSPAAARA